MVQTRSMSKAFGSLFAKSGRKNLSIEPVTTSAVCTKSDTQKDSKVYKVKINFNQEAEPERTMILQRCIRSFQTLGTLLGVIGGVYAIYKFIEENFMQHEEHLEVVVLRKL